MIITCEVGGREREEGSHFAGELFSKSWLVLGGYYQIGLLGLVGSFFVIPTMTETGRRNYLGLLTETVQVYAEFEKKKLFITRQKNQSSEINRDHKKLVCRELQLSTINNCKVILKHMLFYNPKCTCHENPRIICYFKYR